MSILIRAAKREEEDVLIELLRETYTAHARELPALYREPDEKFLVEMLEREDWRRIVAERDGVIAGLIQFSLESTRETPIKPARLFVAVAMLQVAPRFRRRGVARALMEHVHDWAAAQGATHVELNVYEFNEAALGLYEELGYCTVSRMMRRSV